ncbi:transmembrane protein 154 isoform X2 [Pseudophryne corroboree]|uniref:transmembrane protein 154 isoform X2 n=1 Tax=Pseudophryne corroboree TaxID=495146 RepID=UPI00308199FE
MQTNICSLSFAVLLSAGLFNDGPLMFTDAEVDQSDTETPTISLHWDSTYLPSTPDPDQTLFPTTEENYNDTDIEVTVPPEVSDLDVTTILTYAAPAIILLLLIPLMIFIVKKKRRKKDKEDMPTSEDIKSPIFEEDTPSVMEIEMDDLDKWMSYMRKGSSRLSTLDEEKHFTESGEFGSLGTFTSGQLRSPCD